MVGRGRISGAPGGPGSRKRRPLGLLVALVMVASLAIPAGVANAVIGASSNPPSTAAPDLRSAAVTNVGQDRVRVCFDQPVASFGGQHGKFHLNGYNDDVVANGTSLGDDPNPDCLLVDFANSASDITQYTILTVDPGAVTNAALSNANLEGAVALTGISLGNGGLPGRTTGPDLTSATKDTVVTNDVLYTHDEVLDSGFCASGQFGLWNNDGSTMMATACSIAPGSTTARVSFADTTNAVRYFERQGAVRDRGGDGGANPDTNPLGSTTGVLTCTRPAGPPAPEPNCTADLTNVTRVDDDEVDFTFDKGTATTCDPNQFYVFEEDSDPYQATACNIRSSSANSTVVRATFPTNNFSPFETPSAGVWTGAITDGGAPALTNTDGALPLATSREASGFTDAPDLERADFDTSFFRVTYVFDENINPATVVPERFCIFDNNGAPTCGATGPPSTVVSASGNQVVMSFPSAAINTAVGALVRTDAVRDYPGNRSAEAAVGRGPAPNAGTVQLSSSSYTVNEGSGSVTITVTRSGGSSGAASVQCSTINGSATAGSDYTAVNQTLNWADGDSSSKSCTVPIIDDLLGEGSETFNVHLSNATGAAMGGPSSATVTITDNDNSGALSFSSATYSVSEAAGLATITVTRTGGNSGTVNVNYSTSNGTATAGLDYTPVSGTLTFGNGVSSQTFTVPITNDNLAEGNETVNLSLSNAGGGGNLTSPSNAVLTIIDDDVAAAGQLSFASGTHTVGENAGSQTITVNRTGGTSGTVSVQYSTANGSATAGSDYQSTSGTLTFLAGETTKTFSVSILNDNVEESTETFMVSLASPSGGATLGSPSATTVSITDDDDSNETRHHNRSITINFDPPLGRGGVVIFGRVGATLPDCRDSVPVKIQRRVRTSSGRRWVTRKSTETEAGGNYAVEVRDLSSRYRAVALLHRIPQQDGSIDICNRAADSGRYRGGN